MYSQLECPSKKLLLGKNRAVELLQKTLDEESAENERLTQIEESQPNLEAQSEASESSSQPHKEAYKMNTQSITQAIMDRIESLKPADYSLWTIGLTQFPNERKKQREWIADSISDAQCVESFFINQKGMKGGATEDLTAHKTIYVYIF